MNIRILTLLALAAFVAISACSAETNTQVSGTEQAVPATNQVKKLKGFLREIRVLALPDEATVAKVKTIIPRMQISRKQSPSKAGPQSLEEACDYLAKNVSMAQPPGACLEHEGIFFFSGGRSVKAETNFLSGFAIRKGDTAIYSWDEETPKWEKK